MGEQANIAGGPQLSSVAMPIIRLMNHANLSWSDREQCARAIMLAINCHESMEAERRYLSGAAQASQRKP